MDGCLRRTSQLGMGLFRRNMQRLHKAFQWVKASLISIFYQACALFVVFAGIFILELKH